MPGSYCSFLPDFTSVFAEVNPFSSRERFLVIMMMLYCSSTLVCLFVYSFIFILN